MRICQKSFCGGELSPALYTRNDLAKYAIGLKTLKNGFVHQEGAVSNRAGLEFVGATKNSEEQTRLIPFAFNTEQTYIIEFGNKYARFIKYGGYIVYPDVYGILYDGVFTSENKTEYYEHSIGGNKVYSQSELEIGITVYSDYDFQNEYGKIQELNTENSTVKIVDNEKVLKRGQIVEIETPYLQSEVFELKYAQNADVLTVCHSKHVPMELSRYSHYDWLLNTIEFKPEVTAPENVKAVWKGKDTNKRAYTYLVTAVDKNDEESNRSETITVNGRYEGYWEAGEYFAITWDSVLNAVEYNVYRSVNGVFGYIGTTTSTSFTDDKIEPDLSSTAPIEKFPFSENNYPSVVNYFQQRKIYANTINNPQTIYTSQTGLPNNFNVSRPLIASDAITLTISEREVNEIRHIIAMNDLVVLTSSAEWKLNGSDSQIQATPPPIAKIQSCYGSSNVTPVVSGNMILFVQAGGSVVRDLGYTYVSDSYDGDELSIFANHLFEGKQVIDMAYSKEPYRILWCIMSDGTVNALTYNRKQEITAWHKHVTKGSFESVAVIRENNEDIPYFVIKRTINNKTKRYVERMCSRIISKTTDSIFLDCALKYSGTPVDELSGLEHLEGENVYVNADGGIEQYIVNNGKIQLYKNASIISVGLPYEFELETLNVEGENTIGIKKLINRVSTAIYKSREDFFICGADDVEIQNDRSIDSINNSELLISGNVDTTVLSYPKEDATVKIKQKYPLPLTILNISIECDVEDL